jgi:hypothetical protein
MFWLFVEIKMNKNGYSRPDSCRVGEQYYLKNTAKNGIARYERVEFLGYRPHPGELVVRDKVKTRVIYRIDLFQRQGEDGKNSNRTSQ